jgi:NAD(P)-dependent dehydrogenase (short-subunit alcohol dehydrogenase family)
MTFSGNVAFITGGGSGMGQLAARNLAASGAKVAALDVNVSGLAETAEGFDNILTLPADVTNPSDIDTALDRGELWVFPGLGTKMGWRMRRRFPNLMWNRIHKTEGF